MPASPWLPVPQASINAHVPGARLMLAGCKKAIEQPAGLTPAIKISSLQPLLSQVPWPIRQPWDVPTVAGTVTAPGQWALAVWPLAALTGRPAVQVWRREPACTCRTE